MNSAQSQVAPAGIDPALFRRLQRAACIAELCPGVTHKLNNALAGTLSNLELVAMEDNVPAEVLEAHRWSQQAAWQAADLNRAFVEFINRVDATPGPVDVDGLIAQTVQFLRRFSDRRVEVVHVPSPHAIYARTQSTILADALVTLVLLSQRLIGGGSIHVSTTSEPSGVLVGVALQPAGHAQQAANKESQALLAWLSEGLAASAGGSLENETQEGRTTAFRLRLPAGG